MPTNRNPRRRALLIGINKFQQVSGLNGCINDTVNMKNILMSFYGFKVQDIRSLTDTQATKTNIIKELQWLIQGVVPGDFLVFHFSSHGSQLPDRSGDEKADRKDEILCCYDMNWTGGGYLLDDDMQRFAHAIPAGVNVEAIFDTCHSGTEQITRSLTPPSGVGERLLRPQFERYLTPPPEILEMSEGITETRSIAREFVKNQVLGSTQSLWSGCGEGQTSADAFIAGKYNGAFTYYFCQVIRQAAGKISREDILKKVRAYLAGSYTQIPELTTNDAYKKRLLFT